MNTPRDDDDDDDNQIMMFTPREGRFTRSGIEEVYKIVHDYHDNDYGDDADDDGDDD